MLENSEDVFQTIGAKMLESHVEPHSLVNENKDHSHEIIEVGDLHVKTIFESLFETFIEGTKRRKQRGPTSYDEGLLFLKIASFFREPTIVNQALTHFAFDPDQIMLSCGDLRKRRVYDALNFFNGLGLVEVHRRGPKRYKWVGPYLTVKRQCWDPNTLSGMVKGMLNVMTLMEKTEVFTSKLLFDKILSLFPREAKLNQVTLKRRIYFAINGFVSLGLLNREENELTFNTKIENGTSVPVLDCSTITLFEKANYFKKITEE